MFFTWLKKYMPRGLYGRAALILLVPVVVIQLVVMVTFSQRYFEDITRQLMRGVVAELNLYVAAVEGIPEAQIPAALAELDARLEFSSTFGTTEPVSTARPWYDISSRVIAADLRAGIEGVEGVDVLTQTAVVHLSILTDKGRLDVTLPRRRASASNPHQLLVIMVVLGAVLTAISYIFLRNQLRPITRMARAKLRPRATGISCGVRSSGLIKSIASSSLSACP